MGPPEAGRVLQKVCVAVIAGSRRIGAGSPLETGGAQRRAEAAGAGADIKNLQLGAPHRKADRRQNLG